jgi:hypothetical protein
VVDGSTEQDHQGLHVQEVEDPDLSRIHNTVYVILTFDKAEQTVCQPVVDGGPEERNQGLHMQDGEDDSLLVGAAARIVQAVQQLAHRLTLAAVL